LILAIIAILLFGCSKSSSSGTPVASGLPIGGNPCSTIFLSPSGTISTGGSVTVILNGFNESKDDALTVSAQAIGSQGWTVVGTSVPPTGQVVPTGGCKASPTGLVYEIVGGVQNGIGVQINSCAPQSMNWAVQAVIKC
jgi:hypothetical protein